MSSRSLLWRRIGVGAVAVATIAAGSPLLLGSVANAAPPTRLVITQDDGKTTAAAGTCTAFTITPTDAFGADANSATVTVQISESPQSDTHDVDFCIVDGSSPIGVPGSDNGAPKYTNERAPQPGFGTGVGTTQRYKPGPGISQRPADSDPQPQPAGSDDVPSDNNNPDSADNVNSADDPQTNVDNNNNPSGRDTASFLSRGAPITFGVAGLLPGAAVDIFAYVDDEVFQTRDNNGDLDDTDPGDDNITTSKRMTVTAGGTLGSVEVNDAVRRVELTPEASFAAKASANNSATHTFSVQAFNANNDLVGFAQPRLIATSGPNTGTVGTCSATGNEGEPATCTYTAQEIGTDTVTAFFNQSAGSPTFGLDAGEPRDTATATTTPPVNTNTAAARTLVLTPESASVAAGQSGEFVAAVTDVDGAPVNGVSVTFSENGPGSFQGGTAGGGASSSRVVTTTDAGRAAVTFLTSIGETGSNTITAVITTTGTQCTAGATGTAPAGQCSDTSPVTITATASPSPSPSSTASPTASPSSTASPTASPSTQGSRYRGLSGPVRVLDTRQEGTRQPRNGLVVLDLSSQITDASATAAVLNVTVTNPTARGFLVAYPNGNPKPGTSNVNFEKSQTQANEVVVGLSSDRKVSLFVDSASAHVIVDLVGSFTTSTAAGTGRITTNTPVRAFDSRDTGTPRRTGEVVIDLSDELPSGATDAILNVTVQGPNARGFVTVFPAGTNRPDTSNVNFEQGQTQANEVVTRVGTGSNAGKVSLVIDSASSALIVDLVGAVTGASGQNYVALSQPQRALDTRNNRGSVRTGNVEVTMPSGVPADATGVVLNVTATNGTRPGFVTVFPSGTTRPETSNVNFPENLTQANEVMTALGSNDRVTLFIGGSGTPAAHVIVDVVGYLTN